MDHDKNPKLWVKEHASKLGPDDFRHFNATLWQIARRVLHKEGFQVLVSALEELSEIDLPAVFAVLSDELSVDQNDEYYAKGFRIRETFVESTDSIEALFEHLVVLWWCGENDIEAELVQLVDFWPAFHAFAKERNCLPCAALDWNPVVELLWIPTGCGFNPCGKASCSSCRHAYSDDDGPKQEPTTEDFKALEMEDLSLKD